MNFHEFAETISHRWVNDKNASWHQHAKKKDPQLRHPIWTLGLEQRQSQEAHPLEHGTVYGTSASV
jgi:hypothetical protein